MIPEIKDSNYQTFDFLGDKRRDSDSASKFKMSNLEEFNFKSCLDIGCNAGYFLFRLVSYKHDRLVGIDSSPKYIDIANNVKKYLKVDVDFILGNIFTTKINETFDLIFCFSTFHYFSNQEDFLGICYNLLNDNGILLLEVEEYPINNSPIIDRTPRRTDKKSWYYPNELKMKELIIGNYVIDDKYISTKQGGSLYDRWFYKLQKI